MIARADLSEMRPRERAELIYQQARSELSARLWRAALGGDEEPGSGWSASAPDAGFSGSLDALLELIGTKGQQPPAAAPGTGISSPIAEAPPRAASAPAQAEAAAASHEEPVAGLGVNARFEPSLDRAARRTGIPAAALAAIVDAEAAKGRDGSWKTHSRNPRSSAAGLGQFLSGTWISEAQRPGTWLNATARAQGWLDERGRVERGARSELLALRYDAEASINAVADYARSNLDRLERAGVRLGESVEEVARAAYLSHHLGPGDAVRFLKEGLAPARARTLLSAQIGAAGAMRRIAGSGNATEAHRNWLLGFVDRHIQPARFAASAADAAVPPGTAPELTA